MKIPRVSLLIPYEGDLPRGELGVLQGVARYADRNGPWDFYGWPTTIWKPMPYLHGWHGNGVIGQFRKPDVIQAAQDAGLPTVNVDRIAYTDEFPCVQLDASALGKVAAEHLLSTHAPVLAWVDHEPIEGNVMFAAFRDRAQASGRDVLGTHIRCSEESLAEVKRMLRKWLSSVPKPVGIVLRHGLFHIECDLLCTELGLRVPQDVAFMGFEFRHPTLQAAFGYHSMTHIRMPDERMGWRAASMLDQMMSHPGLRPDDVYVPPEGVIQSRSTDVNHAVEPIVHRARQLIRELAYTRVTAREIADRLPVSQRALAYKYKEAYGHSIHHELSMMRIKRAERLLRTTTQPIKQIASQCGFQDGRHLCIAFQRHHGIPPTQFRTASSQSVC